MQKKTIGLITIIMLLASLPIGSIIGQTVLRFVDLTLVMQDVFILLSVIICVIASIIFYNSFYDKSK